MDPYIRFAELIDTTFHCSMGEQTENRAFVRIFKRLMSLPEVSLALRLTDSYITPAELAEHTDLPLDFVAPTLQSLAARGFIFEYILEGNKYYKLMEYTPGIFEALTSDIVDEEIASYISDYIQEIEDYNAQNSRHVIASGFKIKTETYSSTMEEILLFLDKTSIYAVTDCLCRIVNKAKGRYCGHPIKDMCIQTGSYAEYFINNGHSRRATKEEVIQIFQKAEAAGLYHEIYPIDYENGCAFICNCCKCGCLVLRASGREQQIPYSSDTRQIDPSLCRACGRCAEECPEAAISLDPSTGKYSIDPDLCFSCGLCELYCQANAIS